MNGEPNLFRLILPSVQLRKSLAIEKVGKTIPMVTTGEPDPISSVCFFVEISMVGKVFFPVSVGYRFRPRDSHGLAARSTALPGGSRSRHGSVRSRGLPGRVALV